MWIGSTICYILADKSSCIIGSPSLILVTDRVVCWETKSSCQVKLPSLQSIYETQHIYLLNWAPSDQERPPRWKNHLAEEWVLCTAMVPNAFYQFCTSTHVRSLLILVCLSASATTRFTRFTKKGLQSRRATASLCYYSSLLLLIFGWLPHNCPFPELGSFTHTGSLKDPL